MLSTISVRLASLRAAIACQDSHQAVALCYRFLQSGAPRIEELRRCLQDAALDRSVTTRPIFVAHVVKLGCAVFAQYRRMPAYSRRNDVLAALVRFLAARKRERPVGRLVLEAICPSEERVEEGKVPKTLMT